jgi:hypothetical protein
MSRGRTWRTMAIVLGLALAGRLDAPAAPPSKGQLLWSKDRFFRIPVTVPNDNRKLVKEMYLWASDDGGIHWKQATRATPDKPEFSFRAPRDGEYWFAVQTLDVNGKIYPNGNTSPEPSLRVIVDSVAPTITLNPQGRRGTMAGVRWEVQDDHLYLSTLTLEYQEEGGRQLEAGAARQDGAGIPGGEDLERRDRRRDPGADDHPGPGRQPRDRRAGPARWPGQRARGDGRRLASEAAADPVDLQPVGPHAVGRGGGVRPGRAAAHPLVLGTTAAPGRRRLRRGPRCRIRVPPAGPRFRPRPRGLPGRAEAGRRDAGPVPVLAEPPRPEPPVQAPLRGGGRGAGRPRARGALGHAGRRADLEPQARGRRSDLPL